MKKKYEMPSIKEVKMELSQCIAVSNGVSVGGSGESLHFNVNASELNTKDDDTWGATIDVSSQKKSSVW